jgi:trypsin
VRRLSAFLAFTAVLAGCGGGDAAQAVDSDSALGSAADPPSEVQPDIVGGEIAQKGAYPFAVLMHLIPDEDGDGKQDTDEEGALLIARCGGALIGARWVLTAAHCVQSSLGGNLWIGEVDRPWTKPELGYGVSRTRDVWIHPDYDDETNENDVALIRLERPATQQGLVFLRANDDRLWAAGTIATVVGWGTTDLGSSSDVLLQARVHVVSDDECAKAYPHPGTADVPPFEAASMFCAGEREGKIDSCQGDSGGPILVPLGPTWVQTGVVSWGEGCGLPGKPGLYSRLETLSQAVVERLESDDVAPVSHPTLEVSDPREVLDTRATLRGRVTPGGLAVVAIFELREADGDAGFEEVGRKPVEGEAAAEVSHMEIGLEPGTRYEYRISAITSTGFVTGPARTFETSS